MSGHCEQPKISLNCEFNLNFTSHNVFIAVMQFHIIVMLNTKII